MPLAAWIALGVVLFLLAWFAHLWFWVRRLAVPAEYAETHRIDASDGGVFVLRRVRGDRTGVPVLMVHGLAANHRNMDAFPDRSMARTVAAEGRDVWLLTLRSGLRAKDASRDVRFATMAERDVPEAIAEVLRRTGHTELDYVGFSMGGMLLYAAITLGVVTDELRRVVIIGSPAILRSPIFGLGFLARLPRVLIPTVQFRLGARSMAFAVAAVPSFAARVIVNMKNVEARRAAQALVTIIEDVPRALHADFAAHLRAGTLHVDGRSALEGLQLARCPALFIAGGGDGLAPPASVKAAFDAWGGDDKTFVVVGQERGRHAYGHGDLAVGSRAEEHVYRPVAEFLSPTPAPS